MWVAPPAAALYATCCSVLAAALRQRPEGLVRLLPMLLVCFDWRADLWSHPMVGPVVVLGVGGILAEIYKDIAIRLAPISVDDARAMVEEVRGLAVIRGYRGLPRGDCAALAQAVATMSQLALLPNHKIIEAEINPLIVKAEGHGIVAVDGLLSFEEIAPAPRDAERRMQ